MLTVNTRYAPVLAVALVLVTALTGTHGAQATSGPTGCVELLVNGDFEAGRTSWTETNSSSQPLITRHSGGQSCSSEGSGTAPHSYWWPCLW